MSQRVFGAIDLGASGGRVMAGIVENESITLHPVHRFVNRARPSGGHLRWDIKSLFDQVRLGLDMLTASWPGVESIGIDTWAVDYGLLDADGRLLHDPIAYRDKRTETTVDVVHRRMAPEELFTVNGLQFLPFTTVYQLAAERLDPRFDRAAHLVLLPDLLAYWLTGELRTEITNASTTGLLDLRTRSWSPEILSMLGLPISLLPDLERPGTVRGSWHGLPVTTVASHDTASAVVGIPASDPHFAYAATGTWSLVGLERSEPLCSEDVRQANFTNELGADDRIRFLRNVGGLWLLQESACQWKIPDLAALVSSAAALPPGGPVFDVDDPVFLPSGNMPERVAAASGLGIGASKSQLARSIIDSLASGLARTVHQAARLSGDAVSVVHLVGGGAQIDLLCQQTANAAGVPVLAGPVEATAVGNVAIQARTHGALPPTLEELRSGMAAALIPRRYEPK